MRKLESQLRAAWQSQIGISANYNNVIHMRKQSLRPSMNLSMLNNSLQLVSHLLDVRPQTVMSRKILTSTKKVFSDTSFKKLLLRMNRNLHLVLKNTDFTHLNGKKA